MSELLRRVLPWPFPAVLAWGLAWAVMALLRTQPLPAAAAPALAAATGAAGALLVHGRWRRLIVAAGFPLSALALGGLHALPAWSWGAALLPLALAYPLRAWHDAPFFPTPARALQGLDGIVALAPGARVLDAGCGLGHGLTALHRLWPQARIEGIEWSRPLGWGAAWRCRFARVRRGDMWAHSWADADLVYLFQRPESMPRAVQKAEREMRAGSWLVSLEFEAPAGRRLRPVARVGTRPAWVYRIGAAPSTAAAARR